MRFPSLFNSTINVTSSSAAANSSDNFNLSHASGMKVSGLKNPDQKMRTNTASASAFVTPQVSHNGQYIYPTIADGGCLFRAYLARENQDLTWLNDRPLKNVVKWAYQAVDESLVDIFTSSLQLISEDNPTIRDTILEMDQKGCKRLLWKMIKMSFDSNHRNELHFSLWATETVQEILSQFFDRQFTEAQAEYIADAIFHSYVQRYQMPIQGMNGTQGVLIQKVMLPNNQPHYQLVSDAPIANTDLVYQHIYTSSNTSSSPIVRLYIAQHENNTSWLNQDLSGINQWLVQHPAPFKNAIQQAAEPLFLSDFFVGGDAIREDIFSADNLLSYIQQNPNFDIFNVNAVLEFSSEQRVNLNECEAQEFVERLTQSLNQQLGIIEVERDRFRINSNVYIQRHSVRGAEQWRLININRILGGESPSLSVPADKYIRDKINNTQSIYQMQNSKDNSSLYRGYLSIVSGMDDHIDANHYSISQSLNENRTFKGKLNVTIDDVLKNNGVVVKNTSKLSVYIIQNYFSAGNFHFSGILSGIDERISNSRHPDNALLRSIFPNGIPAEVWGDINVEREIENRLFNSLGHPIISRDDFDKGLRPIIEEYIIREPDGGFSFVTLSNQFEPLYEPTDKEIYERDIRENPTRNDAGVFFKSYFGEQKALNQSHPKREAKLKDFFDNDGSSMADLEQKFKDSVELEEQIVNSKDTSKYKSFANILDITRRDGLYSKQDAINAALEMSSSALETLNMTAEAFGYNTKPRIPATTKKTYTPFAAKVYQPDNERPENDNQQNARGIQTDLSQNTEQEAAKESITLKYSAPKTQSPRENSDINTNQRETVYEYDKATLEYEFIEDAITNEKGSLYKEEKKATQTEQTSPIHINTNPIITSPPILATAVTAGCLAIGGNPTVCTGLGILAGAMKADAMPIPSNHKTINFNNDVPTFDLNTDEIDDFLNYIESKNINPIWIVDEYLKINNEQNRNIVEGLFRLHPEILARYFSSQDYYDLDKDKKNTIRDKFQAFVKIQTDVIDAYSYDFYNLKMNYESNKLNKEQFINRIFKLDNDIQHHRAKEYLKINKRKFIREYKAELEISHSQATSSIKALKYIKSKNLENFIGENNLIDFFNIPSDIGFTKSELLGILLNQTKYIEREFARKIISMNILDVQVFFKSDEFNQLNNDAKKTILNKFDNILSNQQMVDVQEAISPYLESNKDLASFNQVLSLLLITNADERLKISNFLNDNPNLVLNFLNNDRLNMLNEVYREELKLRLNNLKSDVDLDSLTDDKLNLSNYEDIERLINAFSDSNRLKASECLLGGNNESNRITSKEYITIKKATYILMHNLPKVIEYFNSDSFLKLTKEEQEKRKTLIKERITIFNRDLFKSGMLGVSPDSVITDKLILEASDFVKNDDSDDLTLEKAVALKLIKLPTVQSFLNKLKAENVHISLSELMMIKDFINDALKEGFVNNDDNLIDEIIEWNDLITKLEPIFLYKYKEATEISAFPDQIIPLLEGDADRVTMGSMMLSKIDELKKEHNLETYEIENILIPIFPSDQLVSFIGAFHQLGHVNKYSPFMDLVFRRHFLKETAYKFKGTALGQDQMFSFALQLYMRNNAHSLSDRFGAALTAAIVKGNQVVQKGPIEPIIYDIIYNDLLNGRPYSSLTSEQIQGFVIGNKFWESISSFAPFYQTMKEWGDSVEKIRQDDDDAGTYIRPFVQFLCEAIPFASFKKIADRSKKITSKAKAKLNRKTAPDLWISRPEISQPFKAELLGKINQEGFSQTQTKHLLDTLSEYHFDAQVQKTIVAEALNIDIQKRQEFSGLTPSEYTKIINHYSIIHPDLFKHKIMKLSDSVNLMKSELFSLGYTLKFPTDKLTTLIKSLDNDGISMRKIKVLLSEHMGLDILSMLKFTNMDFAKIKQTISDLSLHHKDSLRNAVSKTDSFHMKTVSTYGAFQELMKKSMPQHSFIKIYLNSINEHRDIDLFTTANLFGIISKGLLTKIKSSNIFFYSFLEQGDYKTEDVTNMDTFKQNFLNNQKDYSLLLTKDNNKQFVIVKYDPISEKKILFINNLPECFSEYEYEKISDSLYSIKLEKGADDAASDWFKLHSVKSINEEYLKADSYDIFNDTTNYETNLNNSDVSKDGDTLIINAKGYPGATFTNKGMFSAKGISDYLYAFHAEKLRGVNKIKLNSAESTQGGFFYSQAQAIANLMNIDVITSEQGHSYVFTPIPELKAYTISANEYLYQKTKHDLLTVNDEYFALQDDSMFIKEIAASRLKHVEVTETMQRHMDNLKLMLKETSSIQQYLTSNGQIDKHAAILSLFLDMQSSEESLGLVSPYSNVQLVTMVSWNNFEDAVNQKSLKSYAIQYTRDNKKYIISLSKNDVLIQQKNHWVENLKKGDANQLIKVEVVDDKQDSHFNNVKVRIPAFEIVNGLDVEILKDTSWYSENGFNNMITTNKDKWLTRKRA